MGPELVQLILAIVGLIAGYLGRRYTEPPALPTGVDPLAVAELAQVSERRRRREARRQLKEAAGEVPADEPPEVTR